MQRLDEKTWAPVGLTSMFDLQRGRESNMAMLEDGDVPLISAKNGSNGLKGFVKTPKRLINGECISLNNDGDGGAGLAYYQPANMALDTHVTALLPKDDIGRDAMLFISECISGLHGFFGHGLSISNPRAKVINIMLPVTDNGEPDYEYMEHYAAATREAKIEQYREYVQKRIDELGNYVEIPSLDEKEWKPIALGHIFEMNIASAVDYGTTHSGEHNFIGRQTTNNGLQGFVSEPCVEHGNCLIVGMVGEKLRAFYQQQGFAASQNILVLRNLALNCFNGLFIAGISKLTFQKYGYGRPIGLKRAAQDLIMLPVNDAGEPDFEYMEQYSKNMMLRKYQQYLAFLDTKK
jgi:type I restriction modification DNA specificity domain